MYWFQCWRYETSLKYHPEIPPRYLQTSFSVYNIRITSKTWLNCQTGYYKYWWCALSILWIVLITSPIKRLSCNVKHVETKKNHKKTNPKNHQNSNNKKPIENNCQLPEVKKKCSKLFSISLLFLKFLLKILMFSGTQ